MWDFFASGMLAVTSLFFIAAGFLAMATSFLVMFGAVVWASGRIKRETAGIFLAAVLITAGIPALEFWAHVVMSLVPYIPKQHLQAVGIASMLAGLLINVALLMYACAHDNRIGVYLMRRAGQVGEGAVRKALRKAGLEAVHDLYVPSGSRVRQLDHVVRVGRRLVVLETKNWQGALYGRAEEAFWTQKIEETTSTIESPLKQVEGQVRALSQATDEDVVGFVVFTDRSSFPLGPPSGVLLVSELIKRLKSMESSEPGTRRNAKGWSQVVKMAGDIGGQAGLKATHEAGFDRSPVREATMRLPFVRRCKGCGSTSALRIMPPARADYSWYWKCKCRTNTPAKLADGWRFESLAGDVVCMDAQGEIIMVEAKGMPHRPELAEMGI